ncbi:MAG: hypothetical protein K9K87_01175 [Desulfotignum sp.]|nr:hypothetical protein [Desulfotignum sp.]
MSISYPEGTAQDQILMTDLVIFTKKTIVTCPAPTKILRVYHPGCSNPKALPAVILRHFKNGRKSMFTQNATIGKMRKQQDVLQQIRTKEGYNIQY